VFAPLYVGFSHDWYRFSLAILGRIVSVPIMAFLIFVFGTMITQAWKWIAKRLWAHLTEPAHVTEDMPVWLFVIGFDVLGFFMVFVWQKTVCLLGLFVALWNIMSILENVFLPWIGSLALAIPTAYRTPLSTCMDYCNGSIRRLHNDFKDDEPSVQKMNEGSDGEEKEKKVPLPEYMFSPLVFWIGNFAHHIYSNAVGDNCRGKVTSCIVWVFMILNWTALISDLVKYQEVRLAYFLACIIVRAIFSPVISFFHPFIVFMYNCRGTMLRVSLLRRSSWQRL
jgi:hypothetical protein